LSENHQELIRFLKDDNTGLHLKKIFIKNLNERGLLKEEEFLKNQFHQQEEQIFLLPTNILYN